MGLSTWRYVSATADWHDIPTSARTTVIITGRSIDLITDSTTTPPCARVMSAGTVRSIATGTITRKALSPMEPAFRLRCGRATRGGAFHLARTVRRTPGPTGNRRRPRMIAGEKHRGTANLTSVPVRRISNALTTEDPRLADKATVGLSDTAAAASWAAAAALLGGSAKAGRQASAREESSPAPRGE